MGNGRVESWWWGVEILRLRDLVPPFSNPLCPLWPSLLWSNQKALSPHPCPLPAGKPRLPPHLHFGNHRPTWPSFPPILLIYNVHCLSPPQACLRMERFHWTGIYSTYRHMGGRPWLLTQLPLIKITSSIWHVGLRTSFLLSWTPLVGLFFLPALGPLEDTGVSVSLSWECLINSKRPWSSTTTSSGQCRTVYVSLIVFCMWFGILFGLCMLVIVFSGRLCDMWFSGLLQVGRLAVSACLLF